ncbi:MAG: tetratricopeptide repeat protein [Solirubrobacteraceae bacterium]
MKNNFSRSEAVVRFEKMLEENENWYYDSDDFCDIINHYLDINDLNYTHKALNFALGQHPENIDIKIKKLDYYLASEKFTQSVNLIKELKEVAKNDTEFLICRAKYYSLTNRPENAIYYYKKALENQEDQDFIFGCIGNEYLNQEKYTHALEAFKTALRYNPDDDYFLESCIECYDELFLTQSCINFLQEFIDVNPYSELAWFQLGLQHYDTNEFENALEAFDYAFVINQKSISALSKKAECYESLGLYEKAIKEYQEILEIDDSPSFTYIKIGDIYNLLNKPKIALREYLKAIHEDPQLDRSWAAASYTYEKMKLYNEALHYMKKASKLDIDNLDYLRQTAFLNIRLSLYEDAIEILKEIIELDKLSFINWYGLAELYIITGEYNQCIALLTQALIFHEKVEFHFQLSLCYFSLNEEQLGKKHLEISLKKAGKRIKKAVLNKFPIILEKAQKYNLL